MLKLEKNIPLDYGLCCMTVTVYHREGLTCQVLRNVHWECTYGQAVSGGVASQTPSFLLVVPGEANIAPGDKIFPGVGPEVAFWQEAPGFTAASVKPRHYMGRLCHTEVRG